jgi:hypothetical protein
MQGRILKRRPWALLLDWAGVKTICPATLNRSGITRGAEGADDESPGFTRGGIVSQLWHPVGAREGLRSSVVTRPGRVSGSIRHPP